MNPVVRLYKTIWLRIKTNWQIKGIALFLAIIVWLLVVRR